MPQRVALLIVVVLSLAVGVVSADVGDGYAVTDLGTLPGKANSWVWQQTISESGVIPAYANDIDNPNAFVGDVPFLWSRRGITVLPQLPGAVDTIPFSLNDSGQVVGSSQPVGEGPHAVVWDRVASPPNARASWKIRALGELPGDIFGHAFAINNNRQIVGDSCNVTSWDPFVVACHAVLWQRNQILPLPPLPGGETAGLALDINERGQIVGASGAAAALWDRGLPTDLGHLGGYWAQAIALNNSGHVVGIALTAAGEAHAFLWEDGLMSDLDVLAGDVFSGAFDVNQKGQIVGMSGAGTTDVATSHAVLWDGGVMIELQTRIPADSGWTLLAALGINERGQISGYGIHDGRYRAFLLTPLK